MSGYSGTPLPRKLGIKAEHRVGVWQGPSHLTQLLQPLPDGVTLAEVGPDVGPANERVLDVVLAFVPLEEELGPALAVCRPLITYSGGLWICWPKKKSPLHRDLAEAQVREMGLATGLVDNKICAVDEDWSGLRFVYRKEDRPANGRVSRGR